MGGGHEQQGPRFGVILQSDALTPLSTVLVAPTSQRALPTRFRPSITIEGDATRVLVEQLAAIDRRRVGDRIGQVSIEEMWTIDDALTLVVGLH